MSANSRCRSYGACSASSMVPTNRSLLRSLHTAAGCPHRTTPADSGVGFRAGQALSARARQCTKDACRCG
jgi:hypothetical protein